MISTKFCSAVEVVDVITCDKFLAIVKGMWRRADSRPKMSAAAAAACRSVRVGGGGATNLAAAAARRDRLRALLTSTRASPNRPSHSPSPRPLGISHHHLLSMTTWLYGGCAKSGHISLLTSLGLRRNLCPFYNRHTYFYQC